MGSLKTVLSCLGLKKKEKTLFLRRGYARSDIVPVVYDYNQWRSAKLHNSNPETNRVFNNGRTTKDGISVRFMYSFLEGVWNTTNAIYNRPPQRKYINGGLIPSIRIKREKEIDFCK